MTAAVQPAPSAARSGAQAGANWGTITAVDCLIHLPKELFDRAWDPIWYPCDFLALAASAQGTQNVVQISSKADFVCMGSAITVTANGAPQTFVQPAAYLVQVLLPGQQSVIGQVASNTGFVHINNIYSQVGQSAQGKWPVAGFFPRNSILTTLITNLDATQRDVRIVYYGFHIY